MQYKSISEFLASSEKPFGKGPVALIFAEDLVEVESTVLHHMTLGFKKILLFAPREVELASDVEDAIVRLPYSATDETALFDTINTLLPAADGLWMYYCYNAEYLFFPFCENRTIGEMLAFNTEERRDTVLSYAIDLYSNDLNRDHNAVSLEHAFLDRSGYYAASRADGQGGTCERQLDFFGGLRWRFEEHVRPERRKIDRVALFKVQKGLMLRPDHTFNVAEFNTYSCPWHHNITAAICSFRTAKALKTNPGSMFDIDSFAWHNSMRFDWNSQQLLDLGLIEPGQWF